MLVCINAIKCFLGKLGEKYSLQKKLETQHDSAPSIEESVNDVMEAMMKGGSGPGFILQCSR